MKSLGEKLRELRDARGLLLREVAAQLEVDPSLLSKIERGERTAKKEQVSKFAEILKVSKDELLTLWLADQVYDVIKDEDLAEKAMKAAGNKLKSAHRKK